jgi:hypothetical protein
LKNCARRCVNSIHVLAARTYSTISCCSCFSLVVYCALVACKCINSIPQGVGCPTNPRSC